MQCSKKFNIIILASFFICINVYSCDLEIYLKKSEEYKLLKLEQVENRLQNKSAETYFLPNISIGIGQYINNDNGLVDR